MAVLCFCADRGVFTFGAGVRGSSIRLLSAVNAVVVIAVVAPALDMRDGVGDKLPHRKGL